MDKYRAFINSQAWRTAKNQTHSYLVWDKLEPEAQYMFREFAQYIRDNGYYKSYFGHTYQYLDIDDFTYWTMGAPINETTILNRATLNGL